MARLRLWIYITLIAAALAGLAVTYQHRFAVEQEFSREVMRAEAEASRIQGQAILFSESAIPSGTTISQFLNTLGFPSNNIAQMVAQARDVYDLRRVRAGNRLAVGRSVLGDFRAVRYQVDYDRELWIRPRGAEFDAELKAIPSVTEVAGVTGTIRDSLFNAVTDAGERAELALQLADIFGWDLDFYTDPQPGDTFRVVVEKKTYRDGFVRYTRIFAAEYVNARHPFQAVLFREPNGRPAYYAPDGQSLKKAFLRSPLKFSARVSSHFNHSRFHPILKRSRPHLGTDYAAPTGTPVQTIGDGRVLSAGTQGGSGKMVHIKHANGYDTQYLHLSRILVRAGEHVSQGQLVGLVGATGLATGPHLDFRIRQHGAYRNFESLRLPPARPVAKSDWAQFVATRDRWLAQFPTSADGSLRAAQPLPHASSGQ